MNENNSLSKYELLSLLRGYYLPTEKTELKLLGYGKHHKRLRKLEEDDDEKEAEINRQVDETEKLDRSEKRIAQERYNRQKDDLLRKNKMMETNTLNTFLKYFVTEMKPRMHMTDTNFTSHEILPREAIKKLTRLAKQVLVIKALKMSETPKEFRENYEKLTETLQEIANASLFGEIDPLDMKPELYSDELDDLEDEIKSLKNKLARVKNDEDLDENTKSQLLEILTEQLNEKKAERKNIFGKEAEVSAEKRAAEFEKIQGEHFSALLNRMNNIRKTRKDLLTSSEDKDLDEEISVEELGMILRNLYTSEIGTLEEVKLNNELLANELLHEPQICLTEGRDIGSSRGVHNAADIFLEAKDENDSEEEDEDDKNFVVEDGEEEENDVSYPPDLAVSNKSVDQQIQENFPTVYEQLRAMDVFKGRKDTPERFHKIWNILKELEYVDKTKQSPTIQDIFAGLRKWENAFSSTNDVADDEEDNDDDDDDDEPELVDDDDDDDDDYEPPFDDFDYKDASATNIGVPPKRQRRD